MNCPKCGEVLELHINESREEGVEYEELEFTCPKGHEFFTRVKEDDLIETL